MVDTKDIYNILLHYLWHQNADDDEPMDLRSRGLCLVPVSFTTHVGGDHGVDYWAPAFGGGFSMDCTESAACSGLMSGCSIISGHSANPKVDCS